MLEDIIREAAGELRAREKARDEAYGRARRARMLSKQAILLLVGHWYENREQVTVGEIAREIPLGVEALLWLDRNIPV